jgi:hypothetical protein
MKKFIFPILLALAVASVPATADVPATAGFTLKTNGYFSFDAVQGPGSISKAAWSLQNIRGGLIFSGELTSGMTFTLEPTLVPGEALDLTQAWVGIAFSQAVAVKAGLFLVPFGRYNLNRRPYEIILITDPDPIGIVFPENWREIGVEGEAKFGSFNLAVFAGNGLAEAADFGSGQQFRDNNKNKAFGGRLGVVLGQSFEIGGSYYRGKADAANERAIQMLGADAIYLTESIRATGEYVKTTIANPVPFGRGKAEGWFGQVEIKWGQWTPAVSYRHYRVDDPFHGPGFAGVDVPGEGLSGGGTRWALGASYSLATNFCLKAEFDRRRAVGVTKWTSTLQFQMAVHF